MLCSTNFASNMFVVFEKRTKICYLSSFDGPEITTTKHTLKLLAEHTLKMFKISKAKSMINYSDSNRVSPTLCPAVILIHFVACCIRRPKLKNSTTKHR